MQSCQRITSVCCRTGFPLRSKPAANAGVINYSMELGFMSQHILIELAKRKPYSTSPEMPKDAVFDSAKGYWLSGSEPLVSPGSKYGALVSKKCDQETGEDQKGE